MVGRKKELTATWEPTASYEKQAFGTKTFEEGHRVTN
jgi:hypothetical protein